MKRIIIIITGGFLSLFLIIGLKSCGGNDAVEVSVENPQRRDIVETVSANGKIQPEVEVKISSDVSGEIIELFVKEGDRVKKGDLLCRIKPDLYESALERVSATVNSSKATLQNTKAQLE
ncbi:MAG TPA: biotin/lipoyl-binding protein, partial [Nitrosopumilaceae archaeon]|nr:biotin/lipoyl-binding protein [Nitrosopumilaceae archaeon]